jgi:hypothetical protein
MDDINSNDYARIAGRIANLLKSVGVEADVHTVVRVHTRSNEEAEAISNAFGSVSGFGSGVDIDPFLLEDLTEDFEKMVEQVRETLAEFDFQA